MAEVFAVMWAAMGFDPALFQRIDERPVSLVVPAIGVAVLAAASTMLGHVATLLLNRLSGWRLASSLLLSATALAVLHVIQVAVTWAVASLALQRPMPLVPLIVVGLLSTAPLAFNFLTALPHVGMGLARVLEAWSYLVVVIGVMHAFEIGFWLSLGLTLVGWVVIQLLSRLLRRPVDWVGSRMWTLATGRPTMVTSHDILAGMPIIPVTQRDPQRVRP